MHNQRRRKKRHTHGMKTVEVTRGKSGYGFTISGQQPCILSCIVSGSPADRCGLKTGDYLLSVNNLSVAKASHDDVVRLIGSSSGTLTLVIAENFNDSDSSDDDYQARPKSKYPNRARLRQQGKNPMEATSSGVIGSGFGRVRTENGRSRHFTTGHNNKNAAIPTRSRALSPVVERFGRDPQDGALGSHPNILQRYQHHQMGPPSRGVENMDPLSVAVYPRRQKHVSAGGAIGGRPSASQGTKHTIITREMRMTKSQSNPEGFGSDLHTHPIRMPPAPEHQQQSSMTAQDLSNILYPSIKPHVAKGVAVELEDKECDDPTPPNIRIVVGYIGSVELPRDAHLPSSRLQSIRSAVRRLRVEHRIHTLVLMEVFIGGIRLKNNRGSFVALYAAEKVAFSGTCPDDKRFFGIVTLHGASCNEVGDVQDDFMTGSSCHVFMVDPELAVHSVHVQKAKGFGVQCSLDPETQLCLEFPHSASNVVQNIGKLYRDRNGGFYDADLEQQNGGLNPQHGPQGSESNSSNSDSGLGFGREDLNNDRVYVVDMPSANVSQANVGMASSSQDSSFNWTSEHSAFQALVDTSLYRSTGESDLSNLLPTVRYPGSGASDPSPNTSSNVNTSNSSNDVSGHSLTQNTLDRLNLRAMPDPRGLHQRCPLVDGLDKQNSADNLRRSMHRFLQTQTQQKHGIEHQSGSDADSLRSSESSQSGGVTVSVVNAKGKNTKSQGVTATGPVGGKDDVTEGNANNPNKLSPRVYQPPGVPGPRAVVDINRSLHTMPWQHSESTVVTDKPPVPDRRPMLPPKTYPSAKTPSRERPIVERPKSTPPFRCNMAAPPLATDEEYDSDPGSVMGTGLDEDWNGKIPDCPEETPDKRRLSDGVFIKKEREKEAENSRLAKGGSFKQIKVKRRPTLSNSHESLVVSDVEFPQKKLNGAPSVNNVLNSARTTENGNTEFGRAAVWAVSFDHLLNDTAGLATFTEFLKKEFSQENIEFWIKCHQYQDINDADKRKVAAHDLYERHLAANACDPVNVDAQARTVVEKGLDNADVSLFNVAQSQIFQLMKQDSYPRFCKCDLYKQCVLAEMEGKPLPYTGEDPTEKQKDEKKSMKKSKSSSSTEEVGNEKRRKSLLPWRNKSEKFIQKVTTDPDLQRWTRKNEDGTVRVGVGSLDLVDLSVMSKELGSPKKEDDGKDDKEGKFCRVILPDGSTTVIPAKSGTPIRAALQRLCERRTLCLSAIEVFQHGSDKALDLTKDMLTLGTKDIKMEQRVLFQIDLPNRKSLVVRAKMSKTLRDVLKPILQKYSYKVDNMVLHMAGTGVLVDSESSASDIEGQRVLVQTMEDFAEWGGFGSHRGLNGKPPLPTRSKSSASLDTGESTEDMTNNMIKEILEGKGEYAHLFDDLGIYDPERKVEDKGRNEDSRNSGIFGFIRRNSIGEKDGAKLKAKTRAFSSQRNTAPTGGPHNSDKPRPRPRAKLKDPEEERFIELLTRVQSHRLDDQRGLTRDQLELPDFLKINKDRDPGRQSVGPDLERSTPRTRERRNSDSSLLDVDVNRRISRSLSQEKVSVDVGQRSPGIYSSPVSNRIPYMDQSFSHDGVVPTYNDAEEVFSHARNFPGSPDMNKSWHSTAGQGQNGVNNLNVKATTPITKLPVKLSPRVHKPEVAKRRTGKLYSHNLNSKDRTQPDDDIDLTVRPLSPDGSAKLPPPPHMPSEGALTDVEIANYPPPTPLLGQRDGQPNGAVPNHRNRGTPPQPPPRRTLTTPKKFLAPSALANTVQKNLINASHNHVHQTSTSSEQSHHSDSTTTTNRSLSPASTPSPTTHDLVLEADSSSPESGKSSKPTKPTPPPRPSKRGTCGSGSSTDEGGRQVKKTLVFEKKDPEPSENTDMQVSYV